MSSYPHDWIPANDFPALLRCARCPAEAALALDVPRRLRPRPAFAKRLIWRASPSHPWRAAVTICDAAALDVRRPPQRAPRAPRAKAAAR